MMAYNPYSYNPYGYSQYASQPQFQPQPQIQMQPQAEPPKQMQYSVINAPSVDYARNYPVAPGNCVSFKIDNQPYFCTKTMSFSLMDKPLFEVYERVKEDSEVSEEKPEYGLKKDLNAVENKIAEIENRITEIEKMLKSPVKRNEKSEDKKS